MAGEVRNPGGPVDNIVWMLIGFYYDDYFSGTAHEMSFN
jgi:hypothetical protein